MCRQKNEIQKLILEVFEESENFNIEIEAYDFQDELLATLEMNMNDLTMSGTRNPSIFATN